MKKIFAIISLAALLMPVSCVKDELAGLENGSLTGKGMAFTAVMGDTHSKTVLDPETGNVSWAAGDAIKFDYEIQKEDYEPVVSSELTEAAVGAATFYVEIPTVFSMTGAEYNATLEEGATPSRHLYAAYPVSVVTEYENSEYTVVIPSVQDGKFESASISLAKWNISKPKDPLEFRNLCGLLQVVVEDENVRQIKVSSSNNIAGRANVGFASVVPFDPYIKEIYADGASKTVTVNVNGRGTYYIAVAPGTLKEFYVELLNDKNEALGDRLAKSEITVERAHVLPLGTLGTGSFAAEGGFFVKPVAEGTGDGSSWDNAANYSTFRSRLVGTTVETVTVYMAGGIYEIPDVSNVSKAQNYTIYGGYPESASGYSLSGRDITAHPTILQENGSGNRVWNFAAGTYAIDGITFTGAKVSNVGAAFSIKKTAVVQCSNCTFTQNTSTKYGGAVGFENLTSTGTRFVNCKFVSNSATSELALGGAVSANNNTTVTTPGTVVFENCLFDKNTSEAGAGAVSAEYVNYRFVNCTFKDNTDKGYNADAIYLKNSLGVDVYCDACNFYYTASEYFGTNGNNGSGSIIKNTAENGVMALNNCLLTGPWGDKTSQVVTNNAAANTVIVNSTLFSQTGYPAVFVSSGMTHVLNSIVLNAAVSGSGRGVATNGQSVVSNSVLTKVDESGTAVTTTTSKTTYNNNLIVVSHQKETFPVEPTWYKSTDGAANMWNNKNATATTVDDCRGKLYYYAWDGAYPDGAEFTNATLEQVTQMVKDADAGFATWLGDRLGKDIRGNARDPQSMWPGSYQK